MSVVVVVGGGLAGALVARALDIRGVDVTVLDAGGTPGGIATAIRLDGYALEPAVGTVLAPHPHLGPLLAGLPIDLVPAVAQRRLVRHHGVNLAVETGPAMLATRLVTFRGKVRALAEIGVPRRTEDEVLSAFLRRRLGDEAGRMAAWLAASGVHAGDPRRLSVQAAFPLLAALERDHGSLIRGAISRWRSTPASGRAQPHVIEAGVGSIAGAVAESLGRRWRSFEVEGLAREHGRWSLHGPDLVTADHVVLALPPETAARLAGVEGDLPLGDLEFAPVAVVWLGTSTPVPEAMGLLVGPGEGFDTLGFLFESAYAPFRAPQGKSLVKAILGGATNPEVVGLDDESLVSRVTSELAQVLGFAPDVEMSHVVRHLPGIPQHTARRRRVLAGLTRSLPPGVSLAGWGYDGVGVSQLASAATALADRLAWELAHPVEPSEPAS